MLPGNIRDGGVHPHHVVVHDRLRSEHGEASGTAKDAADDVFRGFLEPMSDCVLKQLVEGHVGAACWMNPTTGRPHPLVLLQHVNQADGRLRLEVNVPVQGEQVGVLCHHLLPLVADGQLHQLVAEQVVHVHDLRPPLLVSNLVLVLQVADNPGLARQSPDQPAAVRCWESLWRLHLHHLSVVIGGRRIHDVDQLANERIDNLTVFCPVLPVVHLHAVVKEDVGLPLIVVGVHHPKVLLRKSTSGVVRVDTVEGLQHLQHLLLALVPHGGAGIDLCHAVRRFDTALCTLGRKDLEGVLEPIVFFLLFVGQVFGGDLLHPVPPSVQHQGLVDEEPVIGRGGEDLFS